MSSHARPKASAARPGARLARAWYKKNVVTPSVPSGYLLDYEDWRIASELEPSAPASRCCDRKKRG